MSSAPGGEVVNAESNRGTAQTARAGFTLPEIMVASAVGVLIAAGVMTCFLWCAEQATLGVKIAWSQNEAMRAANKLTDYVRNAAAVTNIDVVNGKWVDLLLTNRAVVRLTYTNTTGQLRAGRMLLTSSNNVNVLVARGLTQIMDGQGFTTPMFTLNSKSNILQVAYRVSEPTASDGREANDGDFAICVRFGTYLRNGTR